MVMHFKTQKERLDYLKGGFEEIVPKEAKKEPKKPKKAKKDAENEKKSQNSEE